MPRPSVNDRIYAAIRRQILEGEFRPGDHLDVAALGKHHGGSHTPVLAALNQLVGERLVEKRANDGFFLPKATEFGVRALYLWIWTLLGQALQTSASEPVQPDPRIALDIGEKEPEDLAGATDRLFLRIAALSGNIEMHWALQSANARLRPIRRLEATLMPDAESELRALTVYFVREDWDRLEEGLEAYFRRRLTAASELVLFALHAGESPPPA